MFRWLWFLPWLAVKLEIQWASLAFRCRVGFNPIEAQVEDFPPTSPPYQHLATVWDAYCRGHPWPRYRIGQFLKAAGRYHRRSIKTVLELACGTGLISRQLAREGYQVVGLDVSEDMLREARQPTKGSWIEYVPGDFCRFSLDRTFDAVVCVGDSLSYLDAPGRLRGVLECVSRHLCSGGVFFFHALDEQAFLGLAQLKSVASVGQTSFEVYYFYDPVTRVSESRVVFPDAVERHRRVPIDPVDVAQAAESTDLRVLEVIGTGSRFYLLQKPCR